jgi:hypothetical protein
MKINASKYLKRDIETLTTSLTTILMRNKSKDEYNAKLKSISSFLNNLDNFDLYFNIKYKTLNENQIVKKDESKKIDEPKKSKQQLREKHEQNKIKYTFVQNKLKSYINTYLRTNVSNIAHKIKLNLNVFDLLSEKDNEKWNKKLFNKKKWIEPFLTSDIAKLFKKFIFNYSASEISNIQGIYDIYDKSDKWIKKQSLFNPSDAILVLKHYFITQLNLFIDISGNKQFITANFIDHLFDQIEADNASYKLTPKEIDRYNDSMVENEKILNAKYRDFIVNEAEKITLVKEVTDKDKVGDIEQPMEVEIIEGEIDPDGGEPKKHNEDMLDVGLDYGDSEMYVEDDEAIENEEIQDEIIKV